MLGPLFAPIALGVSCLVGEAANQHPSGQIGVAEVIRNRMERRYASDGTVAGTILRAKQFSCFNDSTPWRTRLFNLQWQDPAVQRARVAWETAFGDDGSGDRSDLVKGAVLYHTIQPPAGVTQWPPRWATAPGVREVARLDDHIFYTDTGR